MICDNEGIVTEQGVTWTAFAILALFIASIFIHLNLNVSFSVCSWNYLKYNRKHKSMAINMSAEKIKQQLVDYLLPPSILECNPSSLEPKRPNRSATLSE